MFNRLSDRLNSEPIKQKENQTMKVILTTIIALCIAVTVHAQDASELNVHLIKMDILGALTKDDAKTAQELIDEGDRQAFVQFALNNHMVVLHKGTIVRLQDVAIWDGVISVRPNGSPICYWIPNNSSYITGVDDETK